MNFWNASSGGQPLKIHLASDFSPRVFLSLSTCRLLQSVMKIRMNTIMLPVSNANTALCANKIPSTVVFMCFFPLVVRSLNSFMWSFHFVMSSFHSVMCSFHSIMGSFHSVMRSFRSILCSFHLDIRSFQLIMSSFHSIICSFHSVMRFFHLINCSFHSIICSFYSVMRSFHLIMYSFYSSHSAMNFFHFMILCHIKFP